MVPGRSFLLAFLLAFLLSASCVAPSPAGREASATPPPLAIDIRYPGPQTELEMGQALHVIAVLTESGQPVKDAEMSLAVRDPSGDLIGTLKMRADAQGTFRSDPGWDLPHRSLAGEWSLEAHVHTPWRDGDATTSFLVRDSTSEELLARYGFWIDAPTLRGISPSLMGEYGDAENGRIVWGGYIPSQHVLPAAWIEIQWRRGHRPLESEDDVRRFFREALGQFGFTPIRALGPFTPFSFRKWAAWRVEARGEFRQDQIEWVVFYAPEMDRTYAIGTTVVLPPTGIDAHAALRDSFAVFPDLHAAGVAPVPLPDLLPAPEALDPLLGARFSGPQPVVLSWSWFRPLADGEIFDVTIDYNYGEANPFLHLVTHQTRVTLPPALYDTPNCGVFNWQVRVMRPAAQTTPGARPEEVVSYSSFYSYVLWTHPPGQPASFPPRCPNAQY